MLVAMFLEELSEAALHHTGLGRNKNLVHGHVEWVTGSTLQLQRVAHENLGLGTWKRTDESTPVTKMGDELGVLDVSDRKHARLVRPDAELSTLHSDRGTAHARPRAQYLRLPSSEQF